MSTILDRSGFNPDKKLKIVGTSPIKHDGIDKVTGRAKFGADMFLPGMLVGKILRSPYPHAIIKSIDTSAAEALPGVKAVVTRADFPQLPKGSVAGDMSRNAMAREKALYDGHPVAAVAATSESIAKQALKLIKVDYEVLPHVIDPVEAMKPDAPILHDHIRTKGVKDAADKPTNVVERLELKMGDVDAGFAQADVIVEHEYDTKPMHQGYIEPQGCVATCTEDGQVELWCCTQGPWVFRDRLTEILKIESSKIRVTQSELGGGFGGKTGFYPEPIAILLARKSKRPVKIALTRGEVFRATGPVSGTKSRIKMGVTRDGKFTAADAELVFQTGAFTGSMFFNAPQAMFTRYDLKNVKTVSYEVVSNRPKVNSFRAPCVPQVVFGVEGVVNELAQKIGMDPLDLRIKNAATEGYKTIYGETFGPIGFVETLIAARNCDHYKSPVPQGQGRGVAAGFWFNRGGETTGTLNIATDGSVTIILGTSDVAGSRISISMMAAEELGLPVDKVRAVMADTHSLGWNRITAGSRTTYSSGMVIIDSARKAITELCRRAALIWGVPEEGVTFEDGYCRPASSNVGEFPPLSIAEIAGKTTLTLASPPSRGAISGRRRAGHRLGAQRGIYLWRGRAAAEPEFPRLSHAGGVRRADDRHRDRGGAQSAPSLWPSRRRRSAGHPYHGGDCQRHRRRNRGAPAVTADVAAEDSQADRGGAGGAVRLSRWGGAVYCISITLPVIPGRLREAEASPESILPDLCLWIPGSPLRGAPE